MEIQKNKSLLPYNTFGVDVATRFFADINNEAELMESIGNQELQGIQRLVLGGGSNVLFTRDFDGVVLKNNLTGIERVSENDNEIILRVGAGENWHQFVMHCVENNYGGIENLSLIPGNVGASPMQNIGAYGVEVKDLVEMVEFIDLDHGEKGELKAEECEFGYRTSVFKTRLKGKKFITAVHFRLQKHPKLNTSYGAIEAELERMGVEASIQTISQAVINIRRSKLPDPKEIGNAGSFFKNPVVDEAFSENLKKDFPDVPVYPAGEGLRKVAAGWLIEKAGWKGKKLGNYGVHARQALVLVNYGGASGAEINDLAEDIKNSIRDQFGIILEKEVNIF